ncbi:S-methyl-5-thioribose-1-phosphate isomerase [Desulfofalx alkaliphila]|uniref:S-methyl-5-thioribose-1-phosphate isomerase n=1 Tax=Desulfofalx alkaliphila TaxID=105483 RepID=UPI000AC8FFAC|nr:S-methyl-5-thioribose-1-phosphate isomerase [Desulfofalx alkaliphila]
MKTMLWEDGALKILDQTKLPAVTEYIVARDVKTVADAIRRLSVRGAPAIGAAAAYGVVIGAKAINEPDLNKFMAQLEKVAVELTSTRPTAVNLRWAVERMLNKVRGRSDLSTADAKQILLEEAHKIFCEDLEANRRMGEHGQHLIPDGAGIITHCNAGALATAGFGTALGVIRAAHRAGKKIHVYADETRPLLQGARLTAWEMKQEDIPVTLITDNMAGYLMSQGKADVVIVGADRIAANGDVANKIGTYSLAVLAQAHGIPFYVAIPLSTLDLSLPSGDQIPIEQRAEDEVTSFGGTQVAPAGVKVWNPAFDVTPNRLVTAIITERGVVRPPYNENLRRIVEEGDYLSDDICIGANPAK